jgi:hypothetical protein
MKIIVVASIALLAWLPATLPAAEAGKPLRPVHTYSIVARDAATGELGAAVQSHWFSVGSNVIWAEPGIGAVATQSFHFTTCGGCARERQASWYGGCRRKRLEPHRR